MGEHWLLRVEESDSSVGFYDPNTGAEVGRVVDWKANRYAQVPIL